MMVATVPQECPKGETLGPRYPEFCTDMDEPVKAERFSYHGIRSFLVMAGALWSWKRDISRR